MVIAGLMPCSFGSSRFPRVLALLDDAGIFILSGCFNALECVGTFSLLFELSAEEVIQVLAVGVAVLTLMAAAAGYRFGALMRAGLCLLAPVMLICGLMAQMLGTYEALRLGAMFLLLGNVCFVVLVLAGIARPPSEKSCAKARVWLVVVGLICTAAAFAVGWCVGMLTRDLLYWRPRLLESVRVGLIALGILLAAVAVPRVVLCAREREIPVDLLREGPSGEGHVLESFARNYRLTLREVDVVHLLVRGYSLAVIAAALGTSASTVDTHVRHVYQKLNVHKRDDLLRLYYGDVLEVSSRR